MERSMSLCWNALISEELDMKIHRAWVQSLTSLLEERKQVFRKESQGSSPGNMMVVAPLYVLGMGRYESKILQGFPNLHQSWPWHELLSEAEMKINLHHCLSYILHTVGSGLLISFN